MRFAFSLIKHLYPRRNRPYINIHTDKLIEWSSRSSYLRYLNELEEKGIVERTRSYLAGQFAKSIKLPGWKFQPSEKAVLFSGRSIETFEDTVKLIFEPWEFRSLLRVVGVKRTTALEMVNRICGEGPAEALDIRNVKVRVTK